METHKVTLAFERNYLILTFYPSWASKTLTKKDREVGGQPLLVQPPPLSNFLPPKTFILHKWVSSTTSKILPKQSCCPSPVCSRHTSWELGSQWHIKSTLKNVMASSYSFTVILWCLRWGVAGAVSYPNVWSGAFPQAANIGRGLKIYAKLYIAELVGL